MGVFPISTQKLAKYLQGANKIVFFTGEVLSRENGIDDFRLDFGTWGKVRPSHIFTAQQMQKNPVEFYKFCLQYLYKYRDIAPGEAHLAIAQFEKLFPEKDITVITQNVDGLHQKAGSRKVIELHGNLKRLICPTCSENFSSDYLDASPGVPKCFCGKTLRPDMVLFFEDIPFDVFFKALEAIKKTDLIIVMCSTLRIFPSNTLLTEKKKDILLIILNTHPTDFDGKASLIIHKKSGPVLRAAIRHMSIRALP